MNSAPKNSKIEQLIDDIEEYIDSCKYATFSNSKIIVSKEEIDHLLSELRKKTPEEIKHYQKIVSNRQAIIDDAKAKAQALIDEATAQTTELINEHEIMLRAYEQADEIVDMASAQAQEIVDDATVEANELKAQAVAYTDSLLAHVEEVVSHYLNNSGTKFKELMDSLNECYETVRSNRQELVAEEQAVPVNVDRLLSDAANEKTESVNVAPARPVSAQNASDGDLNLM